MSLWIKDTLPTESGYYLTYYYNHEHQAMMFKAFWFDVKTSNWVFDRFEPDVKAFWDVRHDYYVPCQTQQGISYIDLIHH